MGSKIFLGKPWHWALLLAGTGLLWYCGNNRLHVTTFNWFVIGTLAGTVVTLFAIIRFTGDGEQVTRDKLVMQAFDPDADTRSEGD